MKLVEMDSSLNARKQLASELHYSGDQNDSASMNVWLHKEVVRRLAENGGKGSARATKIADNPSQNKSGFEPYGIMRASSHSRFGQIVLSKRDRTHCSACSIDAERS